MPRIVVPGAPHHITHRGVRRSDVFWDDSDRLRYLDLFRTACKDFLLRIWAYCLMTNHVHFVAVPKQPESIAKVFHWIDGRYGFYFNRKYGLTGNLWENRPNSSVLDESHALNAIRYVERNPVRAGMVARAIDYRWSSARIRCGTAHDSLLDKSWPPEGIIPDWGEWLDGPDDYLSEKLLREKTASGRPCGSESFVKDLEQMTNRRLSPGKRGRPRLT